MANLNLATDQSRDVCVWSKLKEEAATYAVKEVALSSLLHATILDQQDLSGALVNHLSEKLATADFSTLKMRNVLAEALASDPAIIDSVAQDLQAVRERDPACHSYLQCFLYFKGFMAITVYRVSHYLWAMNRRALACYFQSISSEIFGVDIHPGARIGCGILLDHATSIVVGETAIVEDNVSILHEVTLGGTGKQKGARHPIVRTGVLIGAGSKILGRVEIGACAKIGAGSVVLNDVPPHTTVAGVPAVTVGETSEASPALEMNQSIECGQI